MHRRDLGEDVGKRFSRFRLLCGELSHIFLSTLFFKQCPGCGVDLVYRREQALCLDCQQKLVPDSQFPGYACGVCGRFVSNETGICGECLLNPPIYSKHMSYHAYQDLFRDLILKYKYWGNERLKYYFVQCLERVYKNEFSHVKHFDYLIPMPSDPGHRRSYDHILEIAKLLSKQIQVPLLTGALVKIKKTAPQAGLSRAKRLINLDNAFAFKKKISLSHKKVLFIDDIYTTGTTISKCTQVLQEKGAEVYAITLARS